MPVQRGEQSSVVRQDAGLVGSFTEQKPALQ
jgi:hypothetical protein